MSAATIYAQESRVATLTHDGTVSAFYGVNALINANNAAVDGDIITLSGGSFNGITISKSLTIKGSGMENNENENIEETKIISAINVNMNNGQNPIRLENMSVSEPLRIQSVVTNAIFKKCYFSNIVNNGDNSTGQLVNANFIQCRIDYANHSYENTSSSFSYINCLITSSLWTSSNANATFLNCSFGVDTPWNSGVKRGTFINCVIGTNLNNYAMTSGCSVENCLGYTTSQYNTNPFSSISAKNSTFYRGNVFKDNISYELTDAAKNLVTGTDGTEVGIYGGAYPYNPIPDYPRITKFNVANKTTADGKLSVDIEVKSVE